MSYQNDQLILSTYLAPALLIDLAEQYGVNPNIILKGTPVFLESLITENHAVSLEQLIQMIRNMHESIAHPEVQFLFGQRYIETLTHPALNAIAYSQNIKEAVQRYVEFHIFLTPWCIPVAFYSEKKIILFWLNNQEIHANYLAISAMTALRSILLNSMQEELNISYSFVGAEPNFIEQFWEHLGEDIKFNNLVNAMHIDICESQQKQSYQTSAMRQAYYRQAKLVQQQLGLELSFLQKVFNFLIRNIHQVPNLEECAEYFQMSIASFKRRLHKHHTSYQQLLDQARLFTSIQLKELHHYSDERIANYLNINDIHNFKRAFKRWSSLITS